MPATINARSPVFLALLEEAIETMQIAPSGCLEDELSEALGIMEAHSSTDEDETEIAPLRELGRRVR